MKGKIVATILFAIFLVTVTLPLFVDVSGEVSRIWIKKRLTALKSTVPMIISNATSLIKKRKNGVL